MPTDVSRARPEPKNPRVRIAACQLAILLCGFFLLRLLLFLKFGPHGASWVETVRSFAVGFHLDLFIGLICAAALLGWLAILPGQWYRARWHRIFFAMVLGAAWMLFFFSLIAEFYFFDEFKSRFNTVAVDYLLFPHEVFINIWDAYPVGWVIGICGLFGALIVLFQNGLLQHSLSAVSTNHRWWPIAAATISGIVLYCTISLNEAGFSNERVVGEIAKNGQFAF